MKRLFIALTVSLFFLGSVSAEQSDERPLGPNLLRSNKALKIYSENQKGIPDYVEGNIGLTAAAGEEVRVAYEFFENNKGAFKMAEPARELSLKRIDLDELGMKHIRLTQKYKDLNVIGGEMIAHFSRSGELRTVNGNYEALIDIDIEPEITAQTAISMASDDLNSFFGPGNPDEPELAIFPWDNQYYLAWRLFLISETPMGRWEYFVNAKNGEIIFKANRIMNTNAIGTGIGVMGDPRNHIDTDYNGSIYYMTDYTRQLNNNPHGHDGQMPDGNYIRTYIASTSLPGSVATDADNYWDDASTQRPAVDGHVYTALVYDWLLREFDRNSFDNYGASMRVSVNYSAEGDNNAYWNGSQIVIWSWSAGWNSLAGCPDVIAHEWGHAVTSYCSDLVYQKEPGALNEAFSDMVGSAFEFAHDTLDTPDWLVGENGTTAGDGFRDMSNPHAFGDPDFYGTTDPYWIDVEGCMPTYLNDYCGVHTNCGVGNKWFYLLSDGGYHHGVTVEGIGVENAIRIAYRANAYYWTAATDYHDGALGTMSAASDLDPSLAWTTQASRAWNAVGVSTPGPAIAFEYPEEVPSMLEPGQPTTFEVVVSGILDGVPVPNSGKIYYSINGGAYYEDDMTEVSPQNYEATLPAAACGSKINFYVSADEATTGTHYDPDPSSPYSAYYATSLTAVFEDNFETNQGWTVSGDAASGQWERGVPIGGGDRGDPADDFDGSGSCFLTENVDGDSDIDGGSTMLTSPTIDLSGGDAIVHYARWYSNDFGNDPFNDVMKVYISNNNGADWVVVDSAGPEEQASGGWFEHSFLVSSFVSPTSQMKFLFEASDLEDGSVVEAGLDDFSVKTIQCGANPPIISTADVPDWTVGWAYSCQLEAGGGSGALIWTDKNNNLSGTGLTLSSTGLLSGTPLASGPVSFTAEVTDEAMQSDERLFNFTINEALTITTSTLPDWTIGQPYAQTLAAGGGTGTYSWTDLNSDLDGSGLTLNAMGELSGTPVAEGLTGFTSRASDEGGAHEDHYFEFTINPAVTITTESLPEGTATEEYSYQLESSGGTGSLTWTDKYDDLESTGLTLSAEGLLSGIPVEEMTIEFTAETSDITGSADSRLFGLLINPGYICGDVDDDELINILDIVFLINFIYKSGAAPEPIESGNVNSDEAINILDVVHLINFVYKSGPEPICD